MAAVTGHAGLWRTSVEVTKGPSLAMVLGRGRWHAKGPAGGSAGALAQDVADVAFDGALRSQPSAARSLLLATAIGEQEAGTRSSR